MTKAKKVLSLVLAVVMVAAMFAFSASASADQHATLTVTPSATTAQIGDVITVTVALTTDYYAGPTSVPVYYNPAVFEFVAGSVDGAKIFGDTTTSIASNNDATAGCLKVIFVPQGGTAASAQVLNGGTLFTFQLKAIANGDSPVEVKAADQKTSTNVGGTLYCGAYATSSVDSAVDMYDQTFAITNTSVTVGAAAEPNTLVVKDSFGNAADVIIDKEVIGIYLDWYAEYADAEDASCTGLVYGIEVYDCYLTDALTTTLGDDYLVITQTEAAGGYDSTGAKIEVLDADGTTVLETYYFVYFGDINCDGLIDSTDVSSCVDYVNTGNPFTSLSQFIASDYNQDTFTETSDVASLVQTANTGNSIVQGEAAAAFYAAYRAA